MRARHIKLCTQGRFVYNVISSEAWSDTLAPRNDVIMSSMCHILLINTRNDEDLVFMTKILSP